MKTRVLIGTILLLSSLFISSCIDLTPVNLNYGPAPEGFHYKRFGMPETKTTTVSWTEGDQVCIYSLGEDNLILYKDTVEITNINRNQGSITALVDNTSEQYFAVYPYNAIKSEIGETLNDEDFRVNLSGKFSDVTVMSQYMDTTATSIYMQNRFALLDLSTSTYYGTVTIESSFPSESTITRGNSDYWIPLSYKDESVKITIKTTTTGRNAKTTVREKTLNVTPGTIYTPNSSSGGGRW